MVTLYDLLGALPRDDAEDLRAAFRRAVKGAHPDLNPGDPDAGLKFRQIVRAIDILGDADQRAAYDHLLDLADQEQLQLSKRAMANTVHQITSGAIAFAVALTAIAGGYLAFTQMPEDWSAPVGQVAAVVRQSTETVAATWRQSSEAAAATWRQSSEAAAATWRQSSEAAAATWRLSSEAAATTWRQSSEAAIKTWHQSSEAAADTWRQSKEAAADALRQPAEIVTGTIASVSSAVAPAAPSDVQAEPAAAKGVQVEPILAKIEIAPPEMNVEVPLETNQATNTDPPGQSESGTARPAVVRPPLDLTLTDARAYREHGIAAYRNGDLDGAIADFDQAIQLDPKFAAAYIDRSIVFYRLRKFNRAFADIAHAKRIDKASRAKSSQTEARKPRSPQPVVAANAPPVSHRRTSTGLDGDPYNQRP
jgi:tetratricopeptide (TPR) repeat protein